MGIPIPGKYGLYIETGPCFDEPKDTLQLIVIYAFLRRYTQNRKGGDATIAAVSNGIAFNTLRPRQNGRHFPDDIFKWIFLNENVWIPIKISLKFIPKGPINNIAALVQIMAWRRSGDKPLSEPMMVNLPTHICVTRPQWFFSILKWNLSLLDFKQNVFVTSANLVIVVIYWMPGLLGKFCNYGIRYHSKGSKYVLFSWRSESRFVQTVGT